MATDVVLAQARRVSGTEYAAGATVSVSDGLAAELVQQGLAVFAATQASVSDAIDLARHGVHPDASPSFNLTRINAALRRGCRVQLYGPPGVYGVNDTMVAYSGSALDVGPGIEFRQADGVNKLMFTNYAYRLLELGLHEAVVTITWSAGAVATVNHASHGKTTRDYVLIQGAEASGAVTAATKANPGVLTSAGHGLQSGWVIRFRNLGGMTQLNYVEASSNAYRVVRVNADTFSLETEAGPVDTTSFGTFTSGGEWVLELPEYNHTLRVHKVADADSYKVVLPEVPRRQPNGGTIKVYRADRDIEIDGLALDYNKAGNALGGQGTFRHACILGAIARSRGDGFKARNVEKYGLLTVADTDCTFTDVQGHDCAEIWKHYGPSINQVGDGVYGSAVDDSTTIQAKEPNSFIAYQKAWGDIRGMRLSNVHVETDDSGASSGAVVVYASEFETTDVELTGINCHSDTGNGLQMKYGDTYSVGRLGNVFVRDSRPSTGTPTTKYPFNISCDIDVLVCENVRPTQPDDATSFFRQESQSTIRTLVFRGFRAGRQRKIPAATSYLFNLNGKGGTAFFEDFTLSLDATYGRFITIGTGDWSTIAFRRVSMDAGSMFGIVQASSAHVRTIVMEQCFLKNVATIWDVRSLTEFVLNANEFDTITSGIIRPWTDGVEAATVRARVRGEGNRLVGTVVFIAKQADGLAEAYSWDISADPIAATWIATTNGQYLTSTQAGAEGGKAMRQNGQWFAIGTGASGANTLIT